MRFVVDQPLPRRLVDFFEERGHEAFHLRDRELDRTPDTIIFRLAVDIHAVIVSKDGDFARLTQNNRADVRLIWIRLGNCSNNALLQRLAEDWSRIETQLRFGVRVIELRW